MIVRQLMLFSRGSGDNHAAEDNDFVRRPVRKRRGLILRALESRRLPVPTRRNSSQRIESALGAQRTVCHGKAVKRGV